MTTLSSLCIKFTLLVWIISHWQVFQYGLGRGGIHRTSTGHRGSSGIGSWTPPLLHIHYITGSHHTGTWFLIPFLRWWHTALSLISTRWSNGSCTDLRLPGGHLGVDERTSPTAQPGKDWASCLPCNSNSTAWLHDSVRFINNYPISLGQKSWCNLWWSADLQRAHCKDFSILQVCTSQHQKDQVLPYTACSTTSCVKCFITSTSCDSLPLYNVSLIVFLNSKSLWIKASAKWININVSKHLFGGQIQLIRVTNMNQKPQSQPPLGSN